MAEREYIELVTKVQGKENLEQLGDIFEELIQEARKAGVNVDKFADKLKELANKTKNSLPVYDMFISKMKNIAGITAVGMGMKKSIDLFTSFDDVARRVQATTGATAETMELLRYQAKQLGDTTSWSASEAAEAQFEFAKAGFTSNEILAATSGILDIATASQLGLGEATSITAGALRMFKLDASKSSTVGDMLAKTASATTTDVRGLGESLKYAGVDSRNFGMNLQQTLGILGKLGNEMLADGRAGTNLQSVFSALQNQAKAKILVNAGVNISQDGKYRNFLDILKDIKKATSSMEEVQAGTLINNVFGEQGSQVIKRLLQVPEEELQSLIKDIENSQGFAKNMANLLNNGVGGAFRNMGSAAEGLGISLGEYLEPSVISLINGVTEIISVGTGFIDWLNSGSYMADTMSFAIIGLIAGYGTYKAYLIGATIWEKIHESTIYKKIAAFKFSSMITAIATGAHQLYSAVLGLLTGQITITTAVTWGLNTAMAVLSGPIGLIIAGIVGAGAGFAFLYQKSDRFRKSIEPLIKWLKELWGWVKKFTFVGDAVNIVKAGFGKVKEFFKAGTQGKTDEDYEKEIEKHKKEVQAGIGTSQETAVGAGVNTDYLFTGGASGSGGIKHNGYYLKGSKVINTSQGNIYTGNSEVSETSTPQETSEQLIINTLQLISTKLETLKEIYAEMKTKKNGNTYIVNDKETIASDIVEDLVVMLGNM
ncbi:phage tail tape measure protein [Fusobacterium perfoetens]|uniref:phage tail tape measure protein n=1 Tax=Fusobacterium perfoetens TaxID=852 RepID=UPI001F3EDEFA|nr:phage tail tape measure protein [Fusobacterium perfoetens]MCF2626262.1 phage tail tape measure protein [Fusobacterium perfoetens]